MGRESSELEREFKKYISPEELATQIGIHRLRIVRLADAGRIPDSVTHRGRMYIPKDPEILRGYARREGKLTDYMDDWDKRHGRNVPPPEPEKEDWERNLEDYHI